VHVKSAPNSEVETDDTATDNTRDLKGEGKYGPGVINVSKLKLSSAEESLLQRGLNYVPNKQQVNMPLVLSDKACAYESIVQIKTKVKERDPIAILN
jgi:hypothetical protein